MKQVIADGRATLYTGDCLEVMRGLDDNSVDLILTDPPYFKVKGDAWDRQWDKPAEFLAWLDTVLAEFHRLLRPNGSLYLFASPRMAARVEVLIGGRFEVVNRVTWRKPPFSTKAEMFRKGDLRSFFPASEAIIFAEHYGADNIAKGEAGYVAKCDELRGFVFEPLRAYLVAERDAAGFTTSMVNDAWMAMRGTKGQMAGHWFSAIQFMPPTEANYYWLRDLFNRNGGDYLTRPYEDLRAEYEELRAEYEELRRPFTVTADVPYTDVWDFPTVKPYKGKHPCEKPTAMLRHMIEASTRPDAVVLDAFAGSGSTGSAAIETGRRFIGIERDETYAAQAAQRIDSTARDLIRAAHAHDERLPL